MTRDPLPRTTRRLTGGQTGSFAYMKPPVMSALSLGWDEGPSTTTVTYDTAVIEARRFDAAVEVEVPLSDLAPEAQRIILEMTGPKVVRKIGDGLRREGYLVEPGVEPEMRIRVMAVVYGTVQSWPDVPGVTGVPYRPVGVERVVPVTTLDLSVMLRLEVEHVVHAHGFRAVWLTHPGTYLSRVTEEHLSVVRDDRVPVGVLRLAEQVA